LKKNSYFPYLIISVITLVTRLPLIEKFQSHWDGPQYSIAIVRYSLEQHTPTAPGYPLYIAVGKFFHLFFEDPHTSIVLVSVLASVIGAIVLFKFGREVYNKYVGAAAATLFLTGSTFYYLSLTPYGYLLIASFVVLLALIVYRIFIHRMQEGIAYGLVLGICAGIRPQEIIFIGPLALLGFIYLNRRNKLFAILIFSLVTLLWLAPLVYTSGGIQNYINIHLASTPSQGFTHTVSYNLPLVIKGLLLSVGISLSYLAFFVYKLLFKKIKVNKKAIIFYLTWVTPGLFFNLFIRGEHAGPQLGYLCAILILISYSMWAILRKRMFLFWVILAAVAIFNLYWFFYDRDPNFVKPFRPTSFHYSDIRKNDLKTGSKVNHIKKNFNPKDTLLITADVLWRPYSYYLKDFHLIALFALENNQSPYNHNRYETKNWNMKHLVQKEFTIKIPPGINKVIVIDDKGYEWVQDKLKKKVVLPGNTFLTVFDVSPNTTIRYGYHRILGNL